jgi:CubicO group peptidase (beta-lactamase class C family)
LKKTAIIALFSALFLSAGYISCDPSYNYQIPEQTKDGWRTAGLDDVGIDKKKLGDLVQHIRRGKYRNIHSVLIVKDDQLVFEEYFDGYLWNPEDDRFKGKYTEFDISTKHNIMSVAKAFTSALVGIAIDHGFIQSVDETLFSFFPEYASLKTERKKDITLEHLLTMTSGLQWNEWDVPISEERNDIRQLFIVSDPIAYILSKSVVHEPGTYWYYSGGDVTLLGEVIRVATDLRIDDFAEQYLFKPLGITSYEWEKLNSDIVHASGHLHLSPRSMAKFGFLILNNGVWDGKRIISEKWIKKTTREYIAIPGRAWEGDRFGYQWWLKAYRVDSTTVEAVVRSGWGGQAIFLFPAYGMVVVFTGGNYVDKDPVNEIVARYIIPSVLSN